MEFFLSIYLNTFYQVFLRGFLLGNDGIPEIAGSLKKKLVKEAFGGLLKE